MSTIIDTLKEIITPFYEELESNKVFDLKEEDPGAVCKKGILKYRKGKAIAYKFDKKDAEGKMPTLFPFFVQMGITNLTAMCDFILFYQRERSNTVYLLLCNLKSRDNGNSTEQIKAGICFGNFLVHSAHRIAKDTALPTIEVREVHFRAKRVSEPTTQYKPVVQHYFYSKNDIVETAFIDLICEEN